MAGISPSAALIPSNYTAQTSSAYPANIDGNAIAMLRVAGNGAPRTWPSANMTMALDPVHLFSGGNGPTEVGAWATGTTSTSAATITSVSNVNGLAVGQSVFAYIYSGGSFTPCTPTNAVITAIAGTTVTFSGGNGLANASGAIVVFGQPIGAIVTGNAHGTQVLDSLQSTAGIFVGMAVSGSGVAGGTTVTSVDSASQVHVSANVTAGSGVSFTFAVPTQSGNPRIDRVAVNQASGAAAWVMGAPGASPSPPNVPSGYLPVCQLLIGTSTTAITMTSVVGDERHLEPLGLGTLAYQNASAVGVTVAMNGAAINEAQASTLASASTVAIGAAPGNFLKISGTTTITAFDTVQAGTRRTVFFNNVLTLTFNATSLILPGLANITTSGGDVAEFISLGSGNWICTDYQRASGQAVVATSDNFSSNFYQVREQQPSGTASAFVPSNNTWAIAPLNTEVSLRPTWVTSFSGNQVTLLAGTYDTRGFATIKSNGSSSGGKIRFRATGGAGTLVVGGQVSYGSAGDSSLILPIQGRFALSSAQTCEIDIWTFGSAPPASAQSSGEVEIYADLSMIKVG